MSTPLKKVKSGNFEAAVWENEKDFGEGGIVAFKTVSLKKTWKDSNNVTRDQIISLRKQDVERLLVILRKVQEHLLLEDENEKRRDEY